MAACLLAASFSAIYVAISWPAIADPAIDPSSRTLLVVKLAVECLFAFPAATMILVAAAYLTARDRRRPVTPMASEQRSSVGLVYLCCGDLEREAIDSLLRLRHAGPLHLVVHDDTPGGDPRADRLAARLADHPRIHFHLLRRPRRDGGKPGALNYVLEQVGHEFEYFVVCDNDSVALDPDCIPRMLTGMRDPRIGAVQCRNVAVDDPGYCDVNRVLSRSIDVFHLFLSVASRFGWTPFVGHNAMLRRRAVDAVGRFTPGCFADDIDLTARLNLAGYRVHYAGDVPFGEKHPPSYAAFRKRTAKWSYGSMQVLRRHLGAMLRTRHLSFAEKWGFVQFMGFYTLQSVLLLYVTMFYLVAPLLLDARSFDTRSAVISGSIIPVLIFLPVIVFAIRHRRLRQLPPLLGTCWLGYGATDFPTLRGTLDGLRRGEREWVPTNSVRADGLSHTLLLEAAFGALLLLVPLIHLPQLLLSPLTFVVAAKFLFIPTMAVLYRDGLAPPLAAGRRALATVAGLAVVGTSLLLTAAAPWMQESTTPAAPELPVVRVARAELRAGGEEFVVRGVHYGPWRPRGGPGRTDYPADTALAEDLDLCAELGANAILTFDPPERLLDLAAERGLRVLCAFWIQWPGFATPDFETRHDEIVARVAALAEHPAVLGWVLGNEIPTWVIEERGADTVQDALHALYDDVKLRDPVHFVTHANWPNTRGLRLDFLDVCAFNLYALWPPEVVARGYGNFVGEVLQPIAGERPLLISEYGTNSLEAGEDGQARLVRECWQGLRANDAVGGFAFELADEWWKNYSNPRIEGAWWDRYDDLDDHLRHDRDPEEHYGLVGAERERRKPAFDVVREMYTGAARERGGAGWPRLDGFTILVATLLLAAAASLAWAVRSSRTPGGSTS